MARSSRARRLRKAPGVISSRGKLALTLSSSLLAATDACYLSLIPWTPSHEISGLAAW